MDSRHPAPPRDALTIRSAQHRPRTFVDAIRSRVREKDLDALIAVTGHEGIGKSTFAWVLASNIDPSFNANRVGWSGMEFIRVAKGLEPGQAVVLDEAVQGMINREAMSASNKDLTRFLYVCRERNLAMITAFPRFESLDLVIREHRAWAWCRLVGRGKCEIRIRDPSKDVGHTLEDALEAFPLAGRWSFDAVDGRAWEKYKEKKRNYVQRIADEITDT